MSDFSSSLPVRTQTNGDVVVQLVDGTVTSQKLTIDSTGRITVKLDDAAGNGITSQTNGAQRALDVGINVAGVQIDPRSIRALTSGDVVTANQGTANTAANGWPVKPTDGTNSQAFLATGEGKVSVTQPLPVGTNSIGTVKAQLQDNAGTAITLGQKTMSASVPVVLASDQSTINVKDLSDGPVTAGTVATNSILTGGQFNTTLPTLTTGQQVATQFDSSGRTIVNLGTPIPAGTNLIGGTNVYVGGAIATNANPVPVSITSTPAGTLVNFYATTASVAAAGSTNLDYTITSTKTMSTKQYWASGSGKIKAVFQTSVDGTTFVTLGVGFNSTANPNIMFPLTGSEAQTVGTGAKIRITITNVDILPQDVYGSITGQEN